MITPAVMVLMTMMSAVTVTGTSPLVLVYPTDTPALVQVQNSDTILPVPPIFHYES